MKFSLTSVWLTFVGESLVKQKRRIARKKDYEDFDTYLSAIFNRTSLSREHKDKMKSLYEEQKGYFKFIEPFTVSTPDLR